MPNHGQVLYNIEKVFAPGGALLLSSSGFPSFATQGNRYFVKPYSGNDGADGLSPSSAFKTLRKAKSKMRANQNDICFLLAESNTAAQTTDYMDSAFDWDLDLTHLLGVGANPFLGQRARVAQLSTVKTIEDLFTVSGDNCCIANVGVFQGVASSTATSPRAFVVTGAHNRISGCQLSGNGDTAGSTDTAGARSLVITGAENYVTDSYVGLDTVIRGTQTCEVDVANARNFFERCFVQSYTSLSTFKALTTLSSTTGRFVSLEDVKLSAMQNITSAVAPTGAIEHAQAGSVYFLGKSAVLGYANVATSDNANILVSAPAGGLVDMGLATGVDIA